VKWWAAFLFAGCIGRSTISNPHEGLARLEFHNVAGGPVCELHVFKFGQTDEGPNRIAANTELPSGMHIDMWLTPDTYQVRAGGCPYEKQQVRGYVASEALPRDGLVVLFREDDAQSKATADALVHAHENSALMPAKLLFNANATKKPANVLPPPGARPTGSAADR
jgi:hypothetical protein